MAWDDELEVASFRGVLFQVRSTRDSIEHRVVEHEFPYRNGAELEDTGRRARRTSLEAVFFGDDASTQLGAFAKIADEGKTGLFRHPLLGSWQAKVISFEIDLTHERRDFAAVSIDLREDGTSTELPDVFSVQTEADKFDERVTDAQDAFDAMTLPTDEVQLSQISTAFDDAIADAQDYADDVRDLPAGLDNRLGEYTGNAESAVSVITQFVDHVESYRTVKALRLTVLQARRLKERLERNRPALVIKPIEATVPLALIANDLYEGEFTADDLEAINRIRNPFLVQRDIAIKVYGGTRRRDDS